MKKLSENETPAATMKFASGHMSYAYKCINHQLVSCKFDATINNPQFDW